MSRETKKPAFLFRAMMVFIIAVQIIVIIVLTSMTNEYKDEKKLLEQELDELTLETEKLRQRLEKEMTEENMKKEAEELGYSDPDDMLFQADIPNS